MGIVYMVTHCRQRVVDQDQKDKPMIKYLYPDGTHCYRALHTVHAVYTNDQGKLVSRAERPDRNGVYEFEIIGFELIETGRVYA